MSKNLSAIQTLVQWEARDNQLDLTTTQGLAIANYIYRRLVMLLSPPEFTREDTSLATVIDQEAYTWPSSPVFMDVTKVEIQDFEDDLKYKLIPPARTEFDFSKAREEKASYPIVYRRMYDGSNHKIQFAPTPKAVGTIRITGIVEPTEFTAGTSSTLFLSANVDDALALLIASDIMYKRNFADQATVLAQRAAEILSQVAGREITPAEIASMVGNA